MQTRRAFLSTVADLATFAVGGSLVSIGKDQISKDNQARNIANKGTEKQELENTNKIKPHVVTVNRATDFAIGGVLGITVKKAVEKSTRLNRVNKELSVTISKLQKLENDDLPGIEKTLKEFAQKEGIIHETASSNVAGSITSLLDAILIHIKSYKEASQRYLEELQKLRTALSGPFIEQLRNDSNADAATKEAVVKALSSDKLTDYLGTAIVNALEKTGAGNRISTKIATSLEGQDLLSTDAIVALKQVVIEVMKSTEIKEAFQYAVGTNITEYDIAERLMRILLNKYKLSLQKDDPDLIALKDAIAKALQKEDVSKKLLDQHSMDKTIQSLYKPP